MRVPAGMAGASAADGGRRLERRGSGQLAAFDAGVSATGWRLLLGPEDRVKCHNILHKFNLQFFANRSPWTSQDSNGLAWTGMDAMTALHHALNLPA
jgi:hypothetical protein